jgi:hypothetical protein
LNQLRGVVDEVKNVVTFGAAPGGPMQTSTRPCFPLIEVEHGGGQPSPPDLNGRASETPGARARFTTGGGSADHTSRIAAPQDLAAQALHPMHMAIAALT